jgi:hypothetical protein
MIHGTNTNIPSFVAHSFVLSGDFGYSFHPLNHGGLFEGFKAMHHYSRHCQKLMRITLSPSRWQTAMAD